MAKEPSTARTQLEIDQAARIDRLEDEIRRIAREKERERSKETSGSADRESESLSDIAIDVVRSIVDAHFELMKSVSRALDRSAGEAQAELRKRDDESARDAVSRIPSALAKAISVGLEEQADAADSTVKRFSESFQDNREQTRTRKLRTEER